MNLRKKKALASKVLKIGKKRVLFMESRLGDIKEAITNQDIRDLQKDGAISIKEAKGKKKKIKKPKRRGPGKIRKKINKRKREYVNLTRKLRKYVSELKKQGKLSKEEAENIRKKIRNKEFRSKTHLRENLK